MTRARGDLLGELPFFFRLRHVCTAMVGKAAATLYTISHKAYQQVCATYVDDSAVLIESITGMVERGGNGGKSQSSWTPGDVNEGSEDKVKQTLEDAIKRQGERHVMTFLSAAASADTSTVKRMLDNEHVHVDAADNDGRTALHMAASNGHTAMVRLLVDKYEAKPSALDSHGGAPLDDGIREGHMPVVEFLSTKRNRPRPYDWQKYTDKFIRAAADNDLKVMKLLILAGMNPNCHDHANRTPLHVSASNGCTEAVEYLLSLPGIEVGPVDRMGGTPLWDALVRGGKTEAKLLSQRGAPIQDTVAARLCQEASNNNLPLLELMIDNQVDVLSPVRAVLNSRAHDGAAFCGILCRLSQFRDAAVRCRIPWDGQWHTLRQPVGAWRRVPCLLGAIRPDSTWWTCLATPLLTTLWPVVKTPLHRC